MNADKLRQITSSPRVAQARQAAIWLALIAVAVVIPLYAVKVARKTDYTDFEVYYRAAHRAHLGLWEEIYNLKDGASPFRYAPPLIPFFLPFAYLEISTARLAWYFMQVLWFGLGFYFLFQVIKTTRSGHTSLRAAPSAANPPHAQWITAVSLLFVLRFCLDCFTIGQVSSLLFLGFCVSCWAWVRKLHGLAGAALFVPAVFKIGPGFLFSLFAVSKRSRERESALLAPLVCLTALSALLLTWLGSLDRFMTLWRSWVAIVVGDSTYYDASHYGSQSIKSALLRAVNSGLLSYGTAINLYLAGIIIGCITVGMFWALRRPQTPRARGLFFSMGIFPYLWFMPETFKYSLTTLAIPVAFLLATPPNQERGRFKRFALIFGILTLSVAGLDIIGQKLFFGLQRASIPLLATVLLAIAVVREAWAESVPSLGLQEPELGPWETGPWNRSSVTQPIQNSVLLPLPLQSEAWLSPTHFRRALSDLQSSFAQHSSTELIIAPYGDRISYAHPTWIEAKERVSQGQTHVSLHLLEPTAHGARGAALRAAFLASRGTHILCASLEQPIAPDFFDRALKLLESRQADLVRANRRHPESRFKIPVKHLPVVFGRHRLGLLFNRLVRIILPIQTTDTHAGTWAMSREAATRVFTLQRDAGFLFDLEIGLIAQAHRFREQDLPVTLQLLSEKSVGRISHETLSILSGLPKLAWRSYQGCYAPLLAPKAITADDWGLSPGINQGILELAKQGIVKRVSMMSEGKYLREGLKELRAIPGIELGLHYNLTYGQGRASAPRVMISWTKPGADRAELERSASLELERQLSLLEAAGVQASYLDGHHHIHLVPGMLETLAPILRAKKINRVRLPLDFSLWMAKPTLLLLALKSRRTLQQLGFNSLTCFYPQAKHFADQGLLRARLSLDPQAEVIVHPAILDDFKSLGIEDPYQAERVTEFRALWMLSQGQGSLHGERLQ